MNSFVNMEAVNASAPLKSAHYPFPRGQELQDALTWCVTNYYGNVSAGITFEARGILVTGPSRVGKTKEIRRLVEKFNSGLVPMPDGRPARIVHCILSGRVTWKDLGFKTLEALGYPIYGRRTHSYIWDMVIKQACRQGVIGIHFDECQHVFNTNGSSTNDIFIDSFKTLLKDQEWPLILILSGVPSLAGHIQQKRQLRSLLREVHFGLIDLTQDLEEMNQLAYAFAGKAGLSFDALSNVEFFSRLNHACAMRWGLVIELIIDALTRCKISGATEVSIAHFIEAFARLYGLPTGFSPFTVPDYREAFDPDKLLQVLDRSD